MILVPHAILLAIAYLWSQGVFLPFSAHAFVGVAAALPPWALWCGRGRPLARALLLGPGVAVVGATGLLVWWVVEVGPIGDFGWIVILMVAAAITIFAGYSILVFALAAWWRRRRAPR